MRVLALMLIKRTVGGSIENISTVLNLIKFVVEELMNTN